MAHRFASSGPAIALGALLICTSTFACKNTRAHLDDAGDRCDGGCQSDAGRPELDAAVSGDPDAHLASNEIDDAPDAARPTGSVDAGVCVGVCSNLHVQAGLLSGADTTASGLRLVDQRLSGSAISCGDVNGERLCVRGGVWP